MKRISWDIEEFDSLSSTNNALRAVADTAKEGKVYIAHTQTAGKGTKGRSFISERGGLYMSLLLKPEVRGFDGTGLTALTAVAVCEAVEKVFGVYPKIKWVNDILLNGKKCSGILAESKIGADGFEWVVVGIGVNIVEPKCGFPSEIKDIACAITEKVDQSTYKRFVEEILSSIEKYYLDYQKGKYKAGYKSRSAVIGKSVTVKTGEEEIKGVAIDIDNENRLVIRCGCEERVFSSGEVVKVDYER